MQRGPGRLPGGRAVAEVRAGSTASSRSSRRLDRSRHADHESHLDSRGAWGTDLGARSARQPDRGAVRRFDPDRPSANPGAATRSPLLCRCLGRPDARRGHRATDCTRRRSCQAFLGCRVPLDGISVSGAMCVWFSTDTMTRSVLARSTGGVGFRARPRSVVVAVRQRVGGARGRRAVFGSGTYRASRSTWRASRSRRSRIARPRVLCWHAKPMAATRWTTDRPRQFRCSAGVRRRAYGAGSGARRVDRSTTATSRWGQARIAQPDRAVVAQVTVFGRGSGGCRFMHDHEAQHCDDVHNAGRAKVGRRTGSSSSLTSRSAGMPRRCASCCQRGIVHRCCCAPAGVAVSYSTVPVRREPAA
jgi:hypothetical protein